MLPHFQQSHFRARDVRVLDRIRIQFNAHKIRVDAGKIHIHFYTAAVPIGFHPQAPEPQVSPLLHQKALPLDNIVADSATVCAARPIGRGCRKVMLPRVLAGTERFEEKCGVSCARLSRTRPTHARGMPPLSRS